MFDRIVKNISKDIVGNEKNIKISINQIEKTLLSTQLADFRKVITK